MVRIGKGWSMLLVTALSLLAWMSMTLPGQPPGLDSVCRSRDAVAVRSLPPEVHPAADAQRR